MPNARSAQSRSEKPPTVPAAARTMALFETFARERRELTKSDFARLLDLPESSTSDLLNTLHQAGYVARTVTSRRFYPTSRLLAMAQAIAENDPVRAVADEATGHLSRQTGETAAFGVRQDLALEVRSVAEGTHRLRYVLQVGDTFTMHATALGKALLSGLDDDERSRVLRLKPLSRRTPNTKVEPKELEREIEKSRERGYFRARDEGTLGVSSYAVAGLLGDQPVALGIIGPTDRLAENEDKLVEAVVAAGRTVFSSD